MTEAVQELGLYLLITIIIIYLGVSVVLGFDPRMWGGKFSSAFTPGKVVPLNEQGSATIDCKGTAYKLAFKNIGFNYDRKPGASVEQINFVVVLDFNNMLFIGQKDGAIDKIKCTSQENSDKFDCPKDENIEFELKGVSTPTGNQVFHFTVWDAKQDVIDALTKPESCTPACRPTSLSTVLDSYPNSYISSFDITKNVEHECLKSECLAQDQQKCKDAAGCYWHGTCDICPSSAQPCSSYSTEQCAQCAIANASCVPGRFWGCNQR